MFAQVIQGRTSDAKAFRAAMDRWMRDLAPGAIGWLGSTGGVTDDGRVIAVARFESAEAADRNSQRPEQSQWWEETQPAFDGEVTFADSEDVTVDLQGDPDRAGFVQVMRGRVTDAARGKELMAQMNAEDMAGLRPDMLGSVVDRPRGRRVDAGHLLHLRGRGPRGRTQGDAAGGAGGDGGDDGDQRRPAGVLRPPRARARLAALSPHPPGHRRTNTLRVVRSTAPEGRMFLLVLAVPGLLVVLVGYVLGHAAWGWLTPFPSGAEPAGWITGVLLLVATVRLVVVRRRRPGR